MPAVPFQPGEVVRIRDERWVVARHAPPSETIVLEVRGCDRSNEGTRAHFLLPFEPVERLPMSRAPRVVRPAEWRRLTRRALAAATPSFSALRAATRANLDVLPFQLQPALAIARGDACRILLADEVGLGKTIQAGLIVRELLERRPDAHVLIVTPAGLREQWQAELQERFDLCAVTLDSAALAASAIEDSANPWAVHQIIVTSIDYVKRPEVTRALEALVWDAAIFDEAHQLAGHSDRHTAAHALAERARTLVLITATPHSGSGEAFDRLCSLGDIGSAFPLLAFRRTRQEVGMAVSRRTTWLRVQPTREEMAMHRALMEYARLVWRQRGASAGAARLAVSVLSRRACSSAASLARSIERRLALLIGQEIGEVQLGLPFGDIVDDEEPVGPLATPGLNDLEEERARLNHILDLARRAQQNESKIRALTRLLRRSREPAIVFTEYRDTLARLAAALDAHAPLQIHGGLGRTERAEVLQRFTAGNSPLLLATDAASEGLNLQHRCRLVINLELPWTPIRLEQRAGRVDRIGQRRRVHVVHLLASGTSEERTTAVLAQRTETASGILGSIERASIDEQHTARCVIEADSPVPPPTIVPALPTGVEVVDLRALASAEAERITRARSLGGRSHDLEPGSRPWITVMRSRCKACRCYWAFNLPFTDDELRPVWTSLFGIAGSIAVVPARPRDVRHWVHSRLGMFTTLVNTQQHAAFDSLTVALRPATALFTRRERAIAEQLKMERARLARSLVQRRLFDRRTERLTDLQTAVMDEALARCSARLVDLGRHEQIAPHTPQLAFGLLLQ